MSHTYAQVYIHLVFSTKNRVRSIQKEVQPRLWKYMATILRNHDVPVEIVNGLDNHVHLLFQLYPTLALSKTVYLVKTSSSIWMKGFVNDFDWQDGYGAFSVSTSRLEAVFKYIKNQGSYHKRITYEQEYLALLKKHGAKYDPRYVFG